tara:strand:- start:250 stop:543 length:294 start_codon:yes stop_codon:yes gene_type:complete
MGRAKNHVDHPKVRRFKLSIDTIETIDDIKTILDVMDIRIMTDDPAWEKVGHHFLLECVPIGYLKLLRKIGHEGIAKLHYDEIERECNKLLDEEKNV